MNRTLGIVLVVWNVVLTGLAGWALTRGGTAPASTTAAQAGSAPGAPAIRDSLPAKDARIAFFLIDSLREHLDLMKERSAHYKSEGARVEAQWTKELGKAQSEFQELAAKDPTYMTMSEKEAASKRMDELQQRIAELKHNSEMRMQQLEMDILAEVSAEIGSFLKEYNEEARFDYIISVEPAGQIWVGNPGLDISNDMIAGMNARHRARKDVPVDKAR